MKLQYLNGFGKICFQVQIQFPSSVLVESCHFHNFLELDFELYLKMNLNCMHCLPHTLQESYLRYHKIYGIFHNPRTLEVLKPQYRLNYHLQMDRRTNYDEVVRLMKLPDVRLHLNMQSFYIQVKQFL